MSENDYLLDMENRIAVGGDKVCEIRNRLITEMLHHRNLARVIVAPPGHGKSYLAYVYVGILFEREAVRWIDAGRPDLLLALDRRLTARDKIENYKTFKIFVFDNLPFLNKERRIAFKKVIEELLEDGCEVVITMRPTFNLDETLGNKCDLIPAQEMKLGYGEVKKAYGLTESVPREKQGPYIHCKFKSIPSLALGNNDDAEKFFMSLNARCLPDVCRAAIFAILVLQEGNIKDISNITKRFNGDSQKLLVRHYPYLGLDHTSGKFNVCRIHMGTIHEAFREDLDTILTNGVKSSNEFFLESLAKLLIRENDHARAIELLLYEYPMKKRPGWIEKHQGVFHADGFLASMNLLEKSVMGQPHLSLQILLGSLLRCVVYREWDEGRDLFRRITTHRNFEQVHKIIASLLCLRWPVSSMSEKARAELLESTRGIEICPPFVDVVPNITYVNQSKKRKEDAALPKSYLEEVITYFCGLVARNRFTDFEEGARVHFLSFVENDVLMLILVVAYRICNDEPMARLAGDVLNARVDRDKPVNLYEVVLFDALFMRCVNDGPHSVDVYAGPLSLNTSFFGTDEHALLHDIAPYLEKGDTVVSSQCSERKLDDYISPYYLRERLSSVMSLYDIASRQYFAHKGLAPFLREGGPYEELSYKKCPAGVARYVHSHVLDLLDFTTSSKKKCLLDAIPDRNKACNCLQSYKLDSLYRKG